MFPLATASLLALLLASSRRTLSVLTLSVVVLFGLAGCGGGGGGDGSADSPTILGFDTPGGTADVAPGAKTQLKLFASYPDGTSREVTSLATFTSSDTTVATVDSIGTITGVAAGTAKITGTYEALTVSTTVTVAPNAPVVQSIAATPATIAATIGDTQQLQVVATLSDSTTQDVSSSATYSSSSTSVATVSSTGAVTAVAAGSATINISYQGQSASVSVTVAAPPMPTLALSSSTGTIVPAGDSLQLIATRTLAASSTDVTGSATYSSSNTSVATVNAAGVVTTVASGSAVITADYQGLNATVSVTVTAATIRSMAVTPNTTQIAKGHTQQLQAQVTLSDNSIVDVTSQATYVSSGPVATVASGLVTGAAVGTATISATYQGHTATANITVTAAVVESLAITPITAQIAKGHTQQLTATATLSDSTTVDNTSQATYVSSAPAVATVSASGEVTAVNVGAAVITATYQGQSATVSITVIAAIVESLAITPDPAQVEKGDTQQLQVTATLSDSTTVVVTPSQATYVSSAPGVATVNAAGVVTGVAVGTATITAIYQSTTATADITVVLPPIVSLTLSRSVIRLASSTNRQLQVLAKFDDGTIGDVTDSVTWSTSPSVATISTNGLLTTVGTGTATISATAPSGVSVTGNLTATAATLDSVVLLPGNLSVPAGGSLQLIARGIFNDGSVQDITDKMSYATSDPSVAVVSNAGLIVGVTSGDVTITATAISALGSQTTTALLRVTSANLQSLAITPATVSAAVSGIGQQLSAFGTRSDGSAQDLTQSVAWASSDTDVAIVDIHGVVTALNPGTATITATIDGIPAASASFTVSSETIVQLAVTPGDVALDVGQHQPLFVTAILSDGTTKDVTERADLEVSGGLGLIINAALSDQPLLLATATGTGTITASLDGQSAQAALSVDPSQVVSVDTPAMGTIAVGSTIQFETLLQNSGEAPTTNLSYTSSVPSVATVDGLGNVTGVQPGTSSITTIYHNPDGSIFTSSTLVTVTPATLQSISLDTNFAVIAVGMPIQMRAIGTYSDGNVLYIAGQARLTSSDPAVAVVDERGVVTPVATGTTQISATLDGVVGTVTLNISNVVTSIDVYAPTSVNVAETAQLTAFATFSDSSQRDVSSLVTWSSSDPFTALVDKAGNLLGMAAGTADAIATLQGVSGQASVSVDAPATLTSITVTPANTVLTGGLLSLLGTTTQFTATGNYSDGSTLDLTSVAQWSTSNGAVATMSAQGRMTLNLAGLLGMVGLGPQFITVNAVSGGITGTAQVTLTVL